MNSTHAAEVTWTGVAVSCAVANTVLHTLLIPEHLEEMFYIGLLFAVGSAVMLVVAVALVVRKRPLAAWLTGVLVSLGMIVGFALSRTVGLPGGYYEDTWDAPYGPLSLLVEGLFVVAFLAWFSYRTAQVPEPRPTARLSTRQ
ncbi:hypothetical protein AQI88_37830 [Streptomyces cellostaticus]|uniref:Uncharacterized protein n=1 Tax=Streptomyces cellostaticus TaxID=67285 RepID=A0A101NDN2_9ACTN|nr:hypothetical protein [Streptomyces cellostaticus]KUM91286.1 hypothetical protein AQI88_37830 [Streptomyces cellostaticus]GHI09424.1 hypothetical protein Scel_77450 [Streptomyces cellostaticus]